MATTLAPSLAQAQASDRWQADEAAASATLPTPKSSDLVTATTLACDAQRWTLRIEAPSAPGLGDGGAVLSVDGQAFDLSFAASGGAVSATLPKQALDPLKNGVAMAIDFAAPLEETLGDLSYSLRGSRVAIDAVATRCTLRDMDGYAPVTFTPFTSYLTLARDLRKPDIAAFVQSTAAQPTLDAAMAEFGEGRRVLFTRLCGSSWYFGSSGCNITGFAPVTGGVAEDAAGWRVIYDSENVFLYTDPRSASGGWPDLATLPVGSDGSPRLWRWNGETYAFAGELPEEPASDQPLALRPGGD